jgi:hypothetical protein
MLMIGTMGMLYLSRVGAQELIYRMYLAVALFFITNLFSLYRLSKVPLPPLFHDTILINRLVAKEIRW